MRQVEVNGEMTDDWDGRKFSLITRLANEEARSIGENMDDAYCKPSGL